MSIDESAVVIECGDVRLEGMLHDGIGAIALVMLHPHPQYGGDMDSHVVTAVCAAFAEQGATTLRLNFRGTGESNGQYDGGAGERDDARAAIAAARAAAPGAALVLAGYSFGAGVAAAVAALEPPAALLLVSPPVAYAPLPGLPDVPVLLITGELDDVAPAMALAPLASERCPVAVIAGAGHGWWPGIDGLTAEVVKFASHLVARIGAVP